MAKYLPDAVIDAMLAYIRTKLTGISVCSTQPSTFADAYTTLCLAKKNGLASGDLTPGDGDTSGRKITMGAQSGLTVTASGTAAHIAWWGSTTTSTLLLVTTCTTQALTTGNTVNVPAHDFEIRDVA